jgi:conjugative transposon TraN protein
MKKIILLIVAMLGIVPFLIAQTPVSKLPVITISSNLDIHILSPEPIQYADISTHCLAGDLPVKNILRIKILSDSLKRSSGDQDLGIVTIAGESFIAQYRLRLTMSDGDTSLRAQIEINPDDTRPLDFPGVSLNTPQIKELALSVLKTKKNGAIRHAEAYGLEARLNHIYTAGNLVFLDLSFENQTNLPYTPDELRFKIEDKKITKATNVQSIELKPDWQLYPLAEFKRDFHNIYVFKKVTFPDNKVLHVELREKQVSGRTVMLTIKYGDLLHADTL